MAIVLIRCLANPETVGFYRPVRVGLGLWGALSVLWETLGTPRRGAGMAGRRLRLSPVAAGTGVAAGSWLAAALVLPT